METGELGVGTGRSDDELMHENNEMKLRIFLNEERSK